MTDQDENKLIALRREKLGALREQGNAFPNDFRRDALAADLHARYGALDNDELESIHVHVAGRMVAKRVMGKTNFASILDMSGRIQLFVPRDELPDGVYAAFKTWDMGDLIGASGVLYKTKTGELSVKVDSLRLLVKSLRPLPEKFHGLSDQEQRYRMRYVDLIVNEETRRTFQIRAKMIDYLRRFLNARGYLEVETPMMQAIPGGATARPFTTHHNALDIDLYLRVAQELGLKRVIVGGLEKVYELNRIFRNEGLSTRHNPEFTMLEYNEAYVDYVDYMDMTEEMLRGMAQEVLGTTSISYQGERYDFGAPFERLTLFDAILKHNPDLDPSVLGDLAGARKIARRLDIAFEDRDGLGKLQMEIFDATVEPKLRNPTYITGYPTEVSPLSRRSESDPNVTDRFELFVGGREIANAFSELNDSEEQAERFRVQAAERDAGDDEAMYFDADYIRALEYGLPPNAGCGIGIDRLVMFFTDSPSIRDVLLFPLMRPEDSQG